MFLHISSINTYQAPRYYEPPVPASGDPLGLLSRAGGTHSKESELLVDVKFNIDRYPLPCPASRPQNSAPAVRDHPDSSATWDFLRPILQRQS